MIPTPELTLNDIASLLLLGAFQLPYGKLYSTYSVKTVFLVSMAWLEIGSLTCALAKNAATFIAGRAIAGLGAAGILSGVMIIVSMILPLRLRPLYGGILGSLEGLAVIAGPVIGGAIATNIGWPWAFWINLPAGGLLCIAIILFFKAPPSKSKDLSLKQQVTQLDIPGSALLLESIISLLIALDWGGITYAWANPRIVMLFVVFGITLLAFAVYLGLPIRFQIVKNATASASGRMLLPTVIAVIVGGILAGGGGTAIGYLPPFTLLGTVLTSIGTGLIYTFSPNTRSPRWIGYQVIYGLGCGAGVQQPLVGVQVALAEQDMPIGTACVMLGNTLGGAVFISVAQNIFINRLRLLASIFPNLDVETLLGNGLSAFLERLTLSQAERALVEYNSAVQHVFLLTTILEATDNAYDPERKIVMQEVVIQKNQVSFEATQEVASEFQRQHGDKVKIVQTDSLWTVQILAGATVLISKSVKFNRTVAGQIPQGWSAKRYGIPDDIIEQVDPVTLFSLVCTVEALLSSGIIDPYELYEKIHVTEVGNCIGSSMGGLSSLRQMHKDRFVDKSAQSDILQETFINTTSAWINMLLLSSSGPIKTPVGACATSLESLDTGYDLIVAGKAKVCIVGGVEDFAEDVSFEFGSMKATNDSISEFEAGRSPREMSRPTASSRSGFVESQGCGVQILTTAALAIKMGLPIFGVVALSSMAGDKTGRSVPAPGRGVLSNAREAGKIPSRLLDIRYRRSALATRKHQIAASMAIGLETVEEEATKLGADDASVYRKENIDFFHRQATRETAEACFALGNNFWHNQNDISPIRGSLATWNLSVDDITVASLHGTSTVLNDLNEFSVIQAQMNHMGRQEGNILRCVCQKSLTGHSKGAAGAWMMNGALQILGSGVISGNRNADNVDTKLRENKTLLFPTKSSPARHVKAVSITSFGFGQKGAQAIVLHPRSVLAMLERVEFEGYAEKRRQRHERACQYLLSSLVHENMVALKQRPPYGVSEEETALLDPTARFSGRL